MLDASPAAHGPADLDGNAGARLRWQVVDRDGQRRVLGEQRVDIPPDSAFQAVALGPLFHGAAGPARLEVFLEDATGKRLSQSRLSPQDFMAL